MSWNLSVSKVALTDLTDALDGATATGNDDCPTEKAEQVAAGTAAALYIARSGAVLGPFNVSLYGHANPEHEPREGWSNDVVTVNVSRAS